MNETMSETTYRNILRDIDLLELSANEFLNEKSLAERYGISKAPIRSALHRLCMEGVLVSYPRKGYLIVTLTPGEFQQVQQLRVHNECYALELLQKQVTGRQLDKLRQMAEQGTTIEDNFAFHRALAELSGNRFLAELIDKLLGMVTRAYNIHAFDADASSFTSGHTAVVDALEAGDLQGAKRALVADIEQ